jgi:hypothetical protein
VPIETVLPFKLILNVVRSGVSEFDASLMTGFEQGESKSIFRRRSWQRPAS